MTSTKRHALRSEGVFNFTPLGYRKTRSRPPSSCNTNPVTPGETLVVKGYSGGLGQDLIIDPKHRQFRNLDVSQVTAALNVRFDRYGGGMVTDGADTIVFTDLNALILPEDMDSEGISGDPGKTKVQLGAEGSEIIQVFHDPDSEMAKSEFLFDGNASVVTMSGSVAISELMPGTKLLTRNDGYKALRALVRWPAGLALRLDEQVQVLVDGVWAQTRA